MKRTFYLAVGTAIGVAATRRSRRAKEALQAALTPRSVAAEIADAIAELGNAVGAFAADVKAGMREREAQFVAVIDETSGRMVMSPPELAGPQPRHAIDTPLIDKPLVDTPLIDKQHRRATGRR